MKTGENDPKSLFFFKIQFYGMPACISCGHLCRMQRIANAALFNITVSHVLAENNAQTLVNSPFNKNYM